MLILAKFNVFDLHQLNKSPCKFFWAFSWKIYFENQTSLQSINLYTYNKCFQPFFFFVAFLGPKIENLAFIFLILSLSWTQNEMLTFLLPKSAENIFYTSINLWTAMQFGFQDKFFMKKPRKKLTGFFIQLM